MLYRRIAELSSLIALLSLLSPISHKLVTHKTPGCLQIPSYERFFPFVKGSTGLPRLRRCDPICCPTERSAPWPPRVSRSQRVLSTVTSGARQVPKAIRSWYSAGRTPEIGYRWSLLVSSRTKHSVHVDS